MEDENGMVLTPIGVVRTGIRERKGMPPMGVQAAVEIHPQFADGLYRIEKHSHLWVLAWLDRAQERDVLQVIPRNASTPHGVFAVRSPARPNPIGLTLGRVMRVEGTRIEFERLDFVDGTAVVDLKPYFLTRDMVFSARNEAVGKPKSREAMRESLMMQVEQYAGEMTVDGAVAVRIVEHYRAERLGLGEPVRWQIAAPLERPQMLDALTGMTRATMGQGNLRLSGGWDVVEVMGEVEYRLTPFEGGVEEVWGAADEGLFRVRGTGHG